MKTVALGEGLSELSVQSRKDTHVPLKEDRGEVGVQKLPEYLLSTLEIVSASQNALQHTAILCSCRSGDYGAGSRTWGLVWQGASVSSGIISSLQGTKHAVST